MKNIIIWNNKSNYIAKSRHNCWHDTVSQYKWKDTRFFIFFWDGKDTSARFEKIYFEEHTQICRLCRFRPDNPHELFFHFKRRVRVKSYKCFFSLDIARQKGTYVGISFSTASSTCSKLFSVSMCRDSSEICHTPSAQSKCSHIVTGHILQKQVWRVLRKT